MIELSGLAGPATALSVCPSTGNLLIATASLLTIWRYKLAGSTTAPRPAKFIDFEVRIKAGTGNCSIRYSANRNRRIQYWYRISFQIFEELSC
jgi:hypothetical protein